MKRIFFEKRKDDTQQIGFANVGDRNTKNYKKE